MEPADRALAIARQNPRSSGVGVKPSTLSNSAYEKPVSAPSLILEKFKILVRQREVELAAIAGDGAVLVQSLSSEDIVRIYEELLSELTLNSKPIITDLTIIAGEQREHGEGIADAICARIIEVSADQKLPSLYLLDSIVKNIGREYVKYFASRLPEVFCKAFRQVQPNLYNSMRHLFGTWSSVFPPAVLRKIETRLEFSSQTSNGSSGLGLIRASESPRPAHGIHVNLKYVRQLEHTNADNHSRGTPILYDEYDSNLPDTAPGHIVSQRLTNGGNSPRRNLAIEHTLGRAPSREDASKEWHRKHYSDDITERFVSSTSSGIHSGQENLGPRALINAYGDDKRKRQSTTVPLHVGRHDGSSVGNKIHTRSWQNTEEEEFDWEDMSPTLVDPGRNSDAFSSAPSGIIGGKPADPRRLGPVLSESGLRNIQSSPSQSSLVESGRGFTGKMPQVHSTLNQSMTSRLPPGRNWQQNLNRPTQKLRAGPRVDLSNSSSGAVLLSSTKDMVAADGSPDSGAEWLSSYSSGSSWSQSSQPLAAKQSNGQFGLLNGSGFPNQNLHKQLPTAISDYSLETKEGQGIYSNQTVVNQHSPFTSQHGRENMTASGAASIHQYSQGPTLNQRYNSQRQKINMVPSYPSSSSISLQNSNASNSYHSQLGVRLPGSSVPRMVTNHPLPSMLSGGTYSGLISSLRDHGFLSHSNRPSAQDALGIDFDADLLKLRHESSIVALYADLPRQCTTCGLRFKCQEEHSNHMDWHVTKNRMSKSRKQKPSRKWFVSSSMWLTGAEALGSEAIPGFLPTETVPDKKEEEELAVPADEEQTTCALCGEAFDDFYSDETEEWMYRGAVYLNAPKGLTADMDKSHFGPIVHAKCRSESDMDSPENGNSREGGNSEEGPNRKRLRS